MKYIFKNGAQDTAVKGNPGWAIYAGPSLVPVARGPANTKHVGLALLERMTNEEIEFPRNRRVKFGRAA